MDVLDGVPRCVLGYQVKTRTQIVLSFLVPAVFELLVYCVLMTADVIVVVEHFTNGNPTWAWLTISFMWLPAVACFASVLSSPSQWPETVGCDQQTWRFVVKHLLVLILFPVAAFYRFNRRIFWTIEALFQEKGSYGRQQAVCKIRETSPFELYHFLQAFLHAAPQMSLQLYVLLRDHTFRNYDTVTAQIVSVVFAFLTMASIITSYQRFESQKIVGRSYPWSAERQVAARKREFLRSTSTAESLLAANTRRNPLEGDPMVPNIMRNFYSKYGEGPSSPSGSQRKTINVDPSNFDNKSSKELSDPYVNYTDDDKMEVCDTVDSLSPTVSFKQDLEEHIDDIREYVKQTDDLKLRVALADCSSDEEYENPVELEIFDQSPRTPAPPTPAAYVIQRASVLRDIFVFDAECFIKSHVPRLPEGLFDHEKKQDNENADQVDGDTVSLPLRRQMITGLEEDDLIGKSVSFAGWVTFLLMRMIALSVFYVFFPTFFWMVCLNHYLLMVACIIYEVRFHEKLERYYFYLFLAYIYLFSLLEFKIKFIHVRTWYVGYVVLVFAENIAMSALWYNLGSFDSWWFDFLHYLTVCSGILSLLCLTFYYAFLRPKDKVLFVN